MRQRPQQNRNKRRENSISIWKFSDGQIDIYASLVFNEDAAAAAAAPAAVCCPRMQFNRYVNP